MNAANRTELLRIIEQALDTSIARAIEDGRVELPVIGESTYIHMAAAAVNILEAIEDVENYIGPQIGEARHEIGI